MDASVIAAGAAIVVAFVGGIFSLISYPRQKKFDRKLEQRKDRAQAYSTLLVAYAETERWYGVPEQETKFAEAFLKYSQAYSALFNVADNNVIDPTSAFHEFVWVRASSELSDEEWKAKWRELYAKMLVRMRNDAFVENNNVTVDNIEHRLPWYFNWQTEKKAHARLE